jgi:multidrug efflux pump subunit AcrA (membrane-fusion protein)
MHRFLIDRFLELRAGRGRLAVALLAASAVGCGHEHAAEVRSVAEPPNVQVTRAGIHDVVRVVGQPSFVEAYERTSIYPKLTGFIQKWYVDIGDAVRGDEVLADLFVPEIVEEWKTKGATVAYDVKRVKLAEKTVLVAEADVKVAEAKLKAAKATWSQYVAAAKRWDSETVRLRREVERGVVDPQILLETENRLRACLAKREEAKADVTKAEADVESKNARLREDIVAVNVAKADVDVAQSDYERLGAWADGAPGRKPYIKLFAPFDGVVVARNVNTWDFVLPAAGDPSADYKAPYLSPSGEAAPIYVVDRTDVVRIFVDIPEQSANYVRVGSKAVVMVQAFSSQPIMGTVTRTSWALHVHSRTLRAEIDLPNTHSAIPDDVPQVVHDAISQVKLPETTGQILPGMYAYGKVIIERPHVRALPTAALMRVGEKTYCFRYEDGVVVQTEIQTGLVDTKGKWIEVINRRRTPRTDTGVRKVSYLGPTRAFQDHASAMERESEAWAPFDGSEQVILGDLSVLSDGSPVRIAAPVAANNSDREFEG